MHACTEISRINIAIFEAICLKIFLISRAVLLQWYKFDRGRISIKVKYVSGRSVYKMH